MENTVESLQHTKHPAYIRRKRWQGEKICKNNVPSLNSSSACPKILEIDNRTEKERIQPCEVLRNRLLNLQISPTPNLLPTAKQLQKRNIVVKNLREIIQKGGQSSEEDIDEVSIAEFEVKIPVPSKDVFDGVRDEIVSTVKDVVSKKPISSAKYVQEETKELSEVKSDTSDSSEPFEKEDDKISWKEITKNSKWKKKKRKKRSKRGQKYDRSSSDVDFTDNRKIQQTESKLIDKTDLKEDLLTKEPSLQPDRLDIVEYELTPLDTGEPFLELVTSDDEVEKKNYVYPYPVGPEGIDYSFEKKRRKKHGCKICDGFFGDRNSEEEIEKARLYEQAINDHKHAIKTERKKRKSFLRRKLARLLAKFDKEMLLIHSLEITKSMGLPSCLLETICLKEYEDKVKNECKEAMYTGLKSEVQSKSVKRRSGQIKRKMADTVPKQEAVEDGIIRIAFRIFLNKGKLFTSALTIPSGESGKEMRLKAEKNQDLYLLCLKDGKPVPYEPLEETMKTIKDSFVTSNAISIDISRPTIATEPSTTQPLTTQPVSFTSITNIEDADHQVPKNKSSKFSDLQKQPKNKTNVKQKTDRNAVEDPKLRKIAFERLLALIPTTSKNTADPKVRRSAVERIIAHLPNEAVKSKDPVTRRITFDYILYSILQDEVIKQKDGPYSEARFSLDRLRNLKEYEKKSERDIEERRYALQRLLNILQPVYPVSSVLSGGLEKGHPIENVVSLTKLPVYIPDDICDVKDNYRAAVAVKPKVKPTDEEPPQKTDEAEVQEEEIEPEEDMSMFTSKTNYSLFYPETKTPDILKEEYIKRKELINLIDKRWFKLERNRKDDPQENLKQIVSNKLKSIFVGMLPSEEQSMSKYQVKLPFNMAVSKAKRILAQERIRKCCQLMYRGMLPKLHGGVHRIVLDKVRNVCDMLGIEPPMKPSAEFPVVEELKKKTLHLKLERGLDELDKTEDIKEDQNGSGEEVGRKIPFTGKQMKVLQNKDFKQKQYDMSEETTDEEDRMSVTKGSILEPLAEKVVIGPLISLFLTTVKTEDEIIVERVEFEDPLGLFSTNEQIDRQPFDMFQILDKYDNVTKTDPIFLIMQSLVVETPTSLDAVDTQIEEEKPEIVNYLPKKTQIKKVRRVFPRPFYNYKLMATFRQSDTMSKILGMQSTRRKNKKSIRRWSKCIKKIKFPDSHSFRNVQRSTDIWSNAELLATAVPEDSAKVEFRRGQHWLKGIHRISNVKDNDVCKCPESEFVDTELISKKYCQICKLEICRDCFGRKRWVEVSWRKENLQECGKIKLVQECLCNFEIDPNLYRRLILGFSRLQCYDCFLGIPRTVKSANYARAVRWANAYVTILLGNCEMVKITP